MHSMIGFNKSKKQYMVMTNYFRKMTWGFRHVEFCLGPPLSSHLSCGIIAPPWLCPCLSIVGSVFHFYYSSIYKVYMLHHLALSYSSYIYNCTFLILGSKLGCDNPLPHFFALYLVNITIHVYMYTCTKICIRLLNNFIV
jgi:hypothetical protein